MASGSVGSRPNPGVLGQSLTLDGRNYTIVGVLPQGFKSPLELQTDQAVELWTPPGYYLPNPCCSHGLNVIGRLREGRTLEQAQAEIKTIIAGVAKDYPGAYPKDGSKQTLLKPLTTEIVGDLRRALWVLLAAVVFVLLIACANVANLQLVAARCASRRSPFVLPWEPGAAASSGNYWWRVCYWPSSAADWGCSWLLWGLELIPLARR